MLLGKSDESVTKKAVEFVLQCYNFDGGKKKKDKNRFWSKKI
jgi:prenyltransferase beta subunit